MTKYWSYTCIFCEEKIEYHDAFHWPNVEYEEGLPLRDPVKRTSYGNGFHWECYLAWEGMPAFARSQVPRALAHEKTTSRYGLAYADDDIVVLLSLPYPDHVPPADLAAETLIKATLAKTGTCVRVGFRRWVSWLTNGEDLLTEQPLFPEERAALLECASRLQSRTWDLPALLQAIDLQEKERLHEIEKWGARDKS